MNRHLIQSFVFATGLMATSLANATTVNYFSTQIGGSQWQYDYSISNDTLGFAIDEFTIYFDLGVYDSLSIVGTPAGWNDLVVQPGSFLGINDGYYDGLANGGSALPPGQTIAGFSVQFNFLGAGTPTSQFFEIVDPNDFSVLDSGYTVTGAVIPLPAATWLFTSGLIGLVGIARLNRC